MTGRPVGWSICLNICLTVTIFVATILFIMHKIYLLYYVYSAIFD